VSVSHPVLCTVHHFFTSTWSHNRIKLELRRE
jgi:hypothetical protein